MLLNWPKFFLTNLLVFYCFSFLSFNMCFCSQIKIDNSISYYHEMPVVNLTDRGKIFQVVIDTGSSDLILSEDILKYYATRTSKTQKFKDATGKKYETPIYNLKSLTLFNLSYQDIDALVDTDFGLRASDTPYENKLKGSIGLSLFLKKILSLDFKNQRADIIGSLDPALIKYHWINFTLTRNGIEFSLQIDGKSCKGILDTGSTISFIKPQFLKLEWKRKRHGHASLKKTGVTHYFAPSQYDKIWHPFNGTSWSLYIFDFDPAVDLIIGMDSLRGKRIIIDFIKQKFLILDR